MHLQDQEQLLLQESLPRAMEAAVQVLRYHASCLLQAASPSQKLPP